MTTPEFPLPQPNVATDEDLTVILANGTFPTADYPCFLLLKAAQRVVCCDGAALPCIMAGRYPDAVVGDGDSLPSDLKQQLGGRFHHVEEQDTNDLNKAFRFCRRNGWNNLVILGATGRREDHTLGNISLLADFAAQIPSVSLVTDEGVFVALVHSGSLSCRVGQQVSLFALESPTPIHSQGLKWPLDGLAPSRWWQATLNEAVADVVTLDFPAGHPLLVFLANVEKS